MSKYMWRSAVGTTPSLESTGLAQEEGNLADINGKITACDTTGLALESGGSLEAIDGYTGSIDGKITACDTTGLALESGGNLDSIDAYAASIDSKVTACDTTSLALESGGNLDTIAGDTTSIDGKITACDTGSIAGTVTANAGTNLNTSALALESGGNLDSIDAYAAALDAKVPSLGQAVAASSVPTVAAEAYQPGDEAPTEIAISDGTSTQSAALTAGLYVITADLDVAFIVAANPTATASSRKLWAWTYRWLQIENANDKVAAIRLGSDTGTVSIEKVG